MKLQTKHWECQGKTEPVNTNIALPVTPKSKAAIEHLKQAVKSLPSKMVVSTTIN